MLAVLATLRAAARGSGPGFAALDPASAPRGLELVGSRGVYRRPPLRWGRSRGGGFSVPERPGGRSALRIKARSIAV